MQPAWKSVAPTDKVMTKVVNGCTYHFCLFHIKWGIHLKADCFAKQKHCPQSGSSVTSHLHPSSPGCVTSNESHSCLTMFASIAAVLDDDKEQALPPYHGFLLVLTCMAGTNAMTSPHIPSLFDPDSFAILVDSRAS
jgi:hypothetical protein